MKPSLLTIAKWVPAAMLGVLVALWLASLVFEMDVSFALPSWKGRAHHLAISCHRGGLHVGLFPNPSTWSVRYFGGGENLSNVLGVFYRNFNYPFPYGFVSVPLPALATLWFPLALGPGLRFRFPLWSWFAWTALVALQCAYYLR